jgi:hypothetical protein
MKLREKILQVGVENIMFLVPMRPLNKVFFMSFTSSNDPESIVPCVIDESKYQVFDNYKIGVKSMDSKFGKQTFYLTDMEYLIKDGNIKMYILSKDWVSV